MALTPIPTFPPIGSGTFNADAYAWAVFMAGTHQTELDALVVAVDADAATASGAAATATTKATEASNSAAAAAAAAASAGAVLWVSGTTYTLGYLVYSPFNYQVYRRIAGAGTTDPSADATNWVGNSGNVLLTATQTLTNKTLTTPTISGTPATTAGNRGFDATALVPTYYNGAAVMQVGYLNIPQNSQSTAYTAVITDAGKHILHPSADTTARTFTIPANASVAYPIGTAITFVNQASAGVVTIAITSDTMRLAGAGTTGSRTLAANGVATAVKLTSTEWIISGTGLT